MNEIVKDMAASLGIVCIDHLKKHNTDLEEKELMQLRKAIELAAKKQLSKFYK